MPVIFTKDTYRAAVEGASGGKQTVLYDDKGYPSIMNIIPKFNIEDVAPVGVSIGSGVHPAFIVGGVEKPKIFIGAYQAAVADGRAISLPGMNPATNIAYDTALGYCTSKGQGWHLMTNWEWAAIALWCSKNGYQPRGNSDYGRSHEAKYETGGLVNGKSPGSAGGGDKTFTGGGPHAWRHDNSHAGIADLVGNVWEWQGGLKLNDGQIYMPNDNNFTLEEALWPAQGVYFDASAGPGDRNGGVDSGDPILSNGISKYSETPTPAGGTDTGDFDYTYIAGAAGWQSIGISAGYNNLTLAKRQLMVQAGIAPKILSTDAIPIDLKGGVWARNYGLRFPLRGGVWVNGAGCGLGALYLGTRRVYLASTVGLRPAFIL
jgi:hypothetical protein